VLVTVDVLDRPSWAALTGPHARFAGIVGRAARYHPDVAPFFALEDPADPRCWNDLAVLAGPGTELSITANPPRDLGWEVRGTGATRQLVDATVRAVPDPEAVVLTASDVPEMIDLVRRTGPGPFRPRTIELGTYLGIRHGGALVAMAGEQIRPPGWSEISAVCTDPGYRGRGLAARLALAVAAEIYARGDRPFLHTMAANTAANHLFTAIGFVRRKENVNVSLRVPVSPGLSPRP
jgi:ribosomal protein S18 acetylase RimI-like enzyme